MGIAVVVFLVVLGGGKLLYAALDTKVERARTTALADRAGTHAPRAMSPEDIERVNGQIFEREAHLAYTVAAATGQLGYLRQPLWKRIGVGLLFGDLAYRGVRDIEHHLDGRG